MLISNCEYYALLNKLEVLATTSSWEKANVIATFLAVIVALFFPLREYIRTLPKYAIQVNVPEIREGKLDGIDKPHIGILIKNLSKETIYLKDAHLYFDLRDYHKIWISLHLGLDSEFKIPPYSEDFVEFLIWHKDANNGYKPIKEFLQTERQVAKQYLEGITGFEKVKNISLNICTNLGRSYKRVPKWGWGELSEQLFEIAATLDKERQVIIKQYANKNNESNFKENFRKYLKEMDSLEERRYQEYKDKCIKGEQEEKERKKRRKELLRKCRNNVLKRIFHL